MEELVSEITSLLIRLGPWIIFVVAFAETSFFVGLLIPAEATVLLGAALAERGYFPVSHVLAATLLGGFLGDQAGYMLGRFGGARLAARGGLVGRLWSRHEHSAGKLFLRHSVLGISLARFISFVRTLMPWFAGMSRIPYRRFVVFDLLGVLGWGIGSVLLGVAAGGSWGLVADALGTASAAIVALLILAAIVIAWRRRVSAPAGIAMVSRLEIPVTRVGLTGNVASGKSHVARVWQGLGAVVIDADELARRAVAPGTAGLAEIVSAFGTGVLASDGSLDRNAMRDLVFSDAAARERLEQIVHPEVAHLRLIEEQRLVESGVHLIVNEIPLLFEADLQNAFDVVVLVDAPADVRLDRIVANRDVSADEARRMIGAQMPSEEKREQADYVIENAGTLAELETRAAAVWREIESASR